MFCYVYQPVLEGACLLFPVDYRGFHRVGFFLSLFIFSKNKRGSSLLRHKTTIWEQREWRCGLSSSTKSWEPIKKKKADYSLQLYSYYWFWPLSGWNVFIIFILCGKRRCGSRTVKDWEHNLVFFCSERCSKCSRGTQSVRIWPSDSSQRLCRPRKCAQDQ